MNRTCKLLGFAIGTLLACSAGGGGDLIDNGGSDGGASDGSARDASASDVAVGDGPRLGKSDASFGPCPLTAVGHPNTEPVTPRLLAQTECVHHPTNPLVQLLRTEAEFDQFRADGGADDAGVLAIDWSTESVIVVANPVGAAFTFGREGTTLEVSEGQYCRGTPSPCERTIAAVPRVETTETLICPNPSEPCMVP